MITNLLRHASQFFIGRNIRPTHRKTEKHIRYAAARLLSYSKSRYIWITSILGKIEKLLPGNRLEQNLRSMRFRSFRWIMRHRQIMQANDGSIVQEWKNHQEIKRLPRHIMSSIDNDKIYSIADHFQKPRNTGAKVKSMIRRLQNAFGVLRQKTNLFRPIEIIFLRNINRKHLIIRLHILQALKDYRRSPAGCHADFHDFLRSLHVNESAQKGRIKFRHFRLPRPWSNPGQYFFTRLEIQRNLSNLIHWIHPFDAKNLLFNYNDHSRISRFDTSHGFPTVCFSHAQYLQKGIGRRRKSKISSADFAL